MKIAIIGTGISGLTCAHYLHEDHDLTIYEANDYIGGHTATVDVEVGSGRYAIDTGFIVYNDRTYPHFISLMSDIGVVGQPTEMSFSVHNAENGLEYNGHNLWSLFAQKRNLVNPRFYLFINEILRFNRLAIALNLPDIEINAGTHRDATSAKQHTVDSQSPAHFSLGAFLQHHGFSDYFCENYILPMGAAIWSSSLSDMRDFPLAFFIRFFRNHGLLEVTNRPQWYVIPGGSREYVKKLTAPFRDHIRLSTPVDEVRRTHRKVAITSQGITEIYDHVIFACHSDQALRLLADPSPEEQDVLGAMEYQINDVVLHTDHTVLPKAKAAWASWNYHLPSNEDGQRDKRLASVTYNMNILQGVQAPETFCVTLNQSDLIKPDLVLRRFEYAHPVFTTESIAAQKQRSQINGHRETWFCGAYWYNGFHEDGVRSALDVVQGIKSQLAATEVSGNDNIVGNAIGEAHQPQSFISRES